MMKPLDFAFWGQDSDFIKSLKTPVPQSLVKDTIADKNSPVSNTYANPSERLTALNFRVPEHKLEEQLQKTRLLSITHYNPLQNIGASALLDDASESDELAKNMKSNQREREEALDRNATLALKRILSAELSNSDQQLKRDIDRCVEVFGRHNTDPDLSKKEHFRVGRDTGSSEVQIAILTVKILNLARACSGKGRHDKSNKRHLQMFIHKRQKLLDYFKRRENGGPRYQNLINQLGLI
jgi:ribosomal protein S15